MTPNRVGNPGPVFLTGATGYLGTYLRRRFHEEGWDVTLLLRDDSTAESRPNEDIVLGDVTDPETLNIDDHQSVVHLAAQTSVDAAIEDPQTTWEVNAEGTAIVLEAAREADVERFLYASTSSVYGIPEYLPIDESHPTNPLDPYGASKLAGDRLANAYYHSYDFPVVVSRLFNTFGPGQPRHTVVPAIVEQIRGGGAIELGNLSPQRDFLYVEDAVDALHLLLTDGEAGEVYNVGRGSGTRIGDLAKLTLEAAGEDLPVVSQASRQRDKDVEIPKHVADVSKLRSLGWEPTYSVLDGLQELLEEM